jgi:poly(3-hydroxybutyrate) depolymerase
VVLAFQGSFFSTRPFFASAPGVFDLFGASVETQIVARLLASGYAVIAPDTMLRDTFWETNLPRVAGTWAGSSDDLFLRNLFALIERGTLGRLNGSRLYALGISSGGYMTSRMAVSYPGRFKALAIASASYATCVGLICSVPDLPANHPPTLFLHGLLDPIVPVYTMESYRRSLRARGREACEIVHTWAGHRWIPEAPLAIERWFGAHL